MLLHSAGFVRHQSNTQGLEGWLGEEEEGGWRKDEVQLSLEVWKERLVEVALFHLFHPTPSLLSESLLVPSVGDTNKCRKSQDASLSLN